MIILLYLLRFWPLLTGKTLFWGDNFSLLVPGKQFSAHWIHQGILPLWNSHILSGISWIGDMSQSVLYPSTFLFSFLPPGPALNLTVIMHVLFTGWGMFLLARSLKIRSEFSLTAAILWSLSTEVTAAMNNLAVLQSLAWIPWVMWARDKRLLPLMITGQLLGGYPYYAVYSVLICLVLTRWSKQMLINLIWALALSAFS